MRKLGFLRIEKSELHDRALKFLRIEIEEDVGNSLNRNPNAGISVDIVIHIVVSTSNRKREKEREAEYLQFFQRAPH